MPNVLIHLRPTRQVTLDLAGGGGRLTLSPSPQAIAVELQPLLRGEKGAPGDSSSRYVHTQADPALIWTVAHNLHARPSVTVVDHLGRQVFSDMTYLNNDIVQITHGNAIGGAVYCN